MNTSSGSANSNTSANSNSNNRGMEILATAGVLEKTSVGTARVASLGGATVQAEVFDGMTLPVLLESVGFSINATDQVTMNGLVVRQPGTTIVKPNAIIVIAGRVSNG